MRRVHLVGTLGQSDVPTSMRLVVERVGQFISTIPDGEPGDRADWVTHQVEQLGRHPHVRTIIPPRMRKDPMRPWHGAVYIARRGHQITAETLALPYARHAAEALPVLWDIVHATLCSYRLQVDVPGPFDLAAFYHGPLWNKYYDTIAEATAAQIRDIEALHGAPTVYQLSIPLETYLVARVPRRAQRLVARKLARRLAEFIATTPAGTTWIVHLCVGDPHGKPLITLADVQPLAVLTDAILACWPSSHLLEVVHWPLGDGQHPCPVGPGYLAPARGLDLPTDLHLSAGLAHLGQGLDAQRGTLDEADRVAGRPAGVSTPCGLGRRPLAAEGLLERMAALARC